MAEIPVEKKSGFPWWLLLLLLLLLAGLIWWLVAAGDDDEVVVDEPVVAEETLAGTDADTVGGDAITDVALIATTSDGSLEGRTVRLTGVEAGEVPDDAGFWIMAPGGERVWVVLEEVLTPDTPIEGRVDVDQGDRVDIVGTIVNADEGSPPDAAIPGPTKPLPDGINHFIHAERVTQSTS